MRKIIILLAVIIGLPVLVFAQVSDSYVLTSNNLTVYQDGVYDVIMTEEQSYTQEVGNPQLPVKTISYVIPYNATVTGINVSISQQKLDGDYYIFPAQQPRRLDGSSAPPFVEPNQAVYGSSAPYPDKAAEIVSDGYTHGYHVVTVAIYPVVYNPADKEIYLRNVSFTINYTGIFDNRLGTPYEKISIKRAELGKQVVQNMVKNINNIESFRNLNAQLVSNSNSQNNQNNYELMSGSTSTIDAIVPDYIIITNNALKPYFQILANWKTKKGVPAIIKTVEEIKLNYNGSDLQEKILNYLKEAYISYGPSNFVLLGGDINIVPDRLFKQTSFATDLYYATVGGSWNANKNDIFGESSDTDYDYDFFLGRASVKDAAEAQRFINKVINYEKYSGLGNNTYVNNFLALVGFLNDNSCGVFYDAGGYNFSKSIKNIANTYMPANMNKWFLFDNYDCQYNSSNPYQYPYSYTPNPIGVCNNDTMVIPGNIDNCATGNQTLSKSNAFSCLNDGTPDNLDIQLGAIFSLEYGEVLLK
ncbi:MAG: C25 family cysteine peptidase [Bacteroidales bacterium]|jgi:hypothetical protein|nr:C25 family cysteine peptidase [Bacteroidales bacterium]